MTDRAVSIFRAGYAVGWAGVALHLLSHLAGFTGPVTALWVAPYVAGVAACLAALTPWMIEQVQLYRDLDRVLSGK